jgi:DNA-binding NtrC family response regulator
MHSDSAHIFDRKNQDLKKNAGIQSTMLSNDAAYHWPGNAREIEAFVERILAVTEGPKVDFDIFLKCLNHMEGKSKPSRVVDRLGTGAALDKGKIVINLGTLADMERSIIQQVLYHVNGDKDRVEKSWDQQNDALA